MVVSLTLRAWRTCLTISSRVRGSLAFFRMRVMIWETVPLA